MKKSSTGKRTMTITGGNARIATRGMAGCPSQSSVRSAETGSGLGISTGGSAGTASGKLPPRERTSSSDS